MAITITITIRKEVADQQAGIDLYEQVKSRLADKPGMRLTGQTSNHFANDEIEG
ncbi:hypothetical protein LCGC14_1124810 [marine sediment metagenome]|uniref:Uncharacterized protein n=1 Tax=marine sediment metagenome TaxID=412755 RepID=A0A0F9MQR9_9ZZZZ